MALKKTQPPRWRGGLSTLIKVVCVFAIIFAFFQIPANPTITGVWGQVVDRADTVAAWVKRVGAGLQEGKLTLGFEPNQVETIKLELNPAFLNPSSPEFKPTEIIASAETIPTSGFSESVSYDRYTWHHWDNITPCWTVREEVLYRDAVKDDTLTILDANKVRTYDKAKACYITGGTWNDPYTGQVFTNPSDLDIDHVVALGYAAKGGGNDWDSAKKEAYANNLDYSHHLLAVSASANRAKSDKGPGDWKPDNKDYYCQYAIDWTAIVTNWGLSMKGSDKSAILDMLKTCKAPQ